MIIKLILILGTLLIGALLLRERTPRQHQARRRVAGVSLVALGVAAIMFPDALTWAAHGVGVQRGTDLLLYGCVLGFLFTTIALYQRVLNLEDQIMRLTREMALREFTESE